MPETKVLQKSVFYNIDPDLEFRKPTTFFMSDTDDYETDLDVDM